MRDLVVEAARAMSDEEASVLSRYASGTTINDLSTVMELPKSTVTQIVQGKGKGGSVSYIINVLKARRDLRERVSGDVIAYPAPAPAPARPAPAPVPARHSRSTPARRTPAAAPAEPVLKSEVTRPPQIASPPVDAKPEVVQPDDPAVTSGDVPITDGSDFFAAASAAPAPTDAQDTDRKDEPPPAKAAAPAKKTPTKKTTHVVPGPRAADLYTDPVDQPAMADPAPAGPDPVLATASDGDMVLPDGIEDVLAIAEQHDGDNIRAVAAKVRAHVDELRAALLVEHRAAALRAQLTALDGEISGLNSQIVVLTDKRDQLRRELQELLAGGDVVVSASAGRVRTTSTASAEHEDTAIRRWARDNHFEVHPNAEIPGGVRAAYRRAQSEA